MTDSSGASSYTFDAANRLTAVNTPRGNITYAYDLTGKRSALTPPPLATA